MAELKFHTSYRSDNETVKFLSFQGTHVYQSASSLKAALKTINHEDSLALPLLRDAGQNNRIDWYSRYSDLKAIDDFSDEEKKRLQLQYFNFRQEVLAKFRPDSSLGEIFREILPVDIVNINAHGEAYYPQIWSNGTDFTLIWGIYRKKDEIILPVIVQPRKISRKKDGGSETGGGGTSTDIGITSFISGWLWLLFCLLLLIAMYFIGCHNCDDIISPITGEVVVNPAPDIFPSQPDQLTPIPTDSLYLDKLTNSIVLDHINIYPKNQDVDYETFCEDLKRLCPDTAFVGTHWSSVVKRVQIKFDHLRFPKMKEKLEVALEKYDPIIWHELLFKLDQINDPVYQDNSRGWHFSAINFNESHMQLSSPNVKIAIVDSDFDLAHPDFKPQMEDGYNFGSNGGKIYLHDPESHGTHVSGLCFATPNNNIGSCGISPNCMFMPIQYLGTNNSMYQQSSTSIIDGILYAIENEADVINLSLGFLPEHLKSWTPSQKKKLKELFQDHTLLFNELYQMCEDAGIVVVTAAGNEGVELAYCPMSNSPYVINVMASNYNGDLTPFSNFTTHDDLCVIVAPGDDIWSTLPGIDAAPMSGTSMSSPIVASAVALMLSQDENLTPQEIRSIINSENKVEVIDGVKAPFLNIESLLNKTKTPL